MAFKEVQSLDADQTISLGGKNGKTGKPNPTKVEGFFLGSKTVADRKKKSGVSFIHIFQTPKGNLGVWGKTDLDRKMQTVAPGVMTRISATGTRPTPNGDMYTFKVEHDPENTIEVDTLPKGAAPVGADSFNDEEDTGFGALPEEEIDEEPEEVFVAPQVSAASAADRKARVEALLKSRK